MTHRRSGKQRGLTWRQLQGHCSGRDQEREGGEHGGSSRDSVVEARDDSQGLRKEKGVSMGVISRALWWRQVDDSERLRKAKRVSMEVAPGENVVEARG